MINLKINKQAYPIESSWRELKYKRYAEIKYDQDKQPFIKRLSQLSGIEQKILKDSTIYQIQQIIGLVQWMEEDPDYKPIEPDVNIANDTYGKMERSKQLFQQYDNPYLAMIEIIKLYIDTDISEMSVFDSWALVDFFLTNSTHFLIASND